MRSIEARVIAEESFKSTNPEDARYRSGEVSVSLVRGSKRVGEVTLQGGGNISSLSQNAQAGDRYYIEVRSFQRQNFRGTVETTPITIVKNIPLN